MERHTRRFIKYHTNLLPRTTKRCSQRQRSGHTDELHLISNLDAINRISIAIKSTVCIEFRWISFRLYTIRRVYCIWLDFLRFACHRQHHTSSSSSSNRPIDQCKIDKENARAQLKTFNGNNGHCKHLNDILKPEKDVGEREREIEKDQQATNERK